MEHDKGYKRLFSHPKMVKDLLRGFVHEEWVRDLDFATLETFKDSFVSDDLRSRHDDIIWRVRWGDDWLYVYLLLEFQSTIDRGLESREEVLGAIRNVLGQLTDWLKEPAQAGLRRDFVTWLLRVLLPNNVPGMQVPEVIELQEINNMLYETAQAWYKEAEEKGEAKGRIEGEAKGEAKILLYQMEMKYGPLETDMREHVNSLNSEALFACSRRLLTARTIQEALANK